MKKTKERNLYYKIIGKLALGEKLTKSEISFIENIYNDLCDYRHDLELLKETKNVSE